MSRRDLWRGPRQPCDELTWLLATAVTAATMVLAGRTVLALKHGTFLPRQPVIDPANGQGGAEDA
ncbi:hypothetical protein ACFQ0G_08990 [Streptomyces chiangmaiensis]